MVVGRMGAGGVKRAGASGGEMRGQEAKRVGIGAADLVVTTDPRVDRARHQATPPKQPSRTLGLSACRPVDPPNSPVPAGRLAGQGHRAAPRIWNRRFRGRTLLAATLPDVDVRALTQRVVGLTLVGKIIDHVLSILTGPDRDGKDALVHTMAAAVGSYAFDAEPDLFMAHERAHPTGQLDLSGVRLTTCHETDIGRRLEWPRSNA